MNNLLAAIDGGTVTGSDRIGNPSIGESLGNILAGGSGAGISFIQKAIPTAVTLLLIAGSLIFVFMFLMGAIDWIMSGGDKAKLEGARGRIQNALLGLFIMFSFWAVAQVIQVIFGVDVVNIDIPRLV